MTFTKLELKDIKIGLKCFTFEKERSYFTITGIEETGSYSAFDYKGKEVHFTTSNDNYIWNRSFDCCLNGVGTVYIDKKINISDFNEEF
jgi:hypothetical protein